MTSKRAKITEKEKSISELSMALQSVEAVISNEDLLTQILVRVPAKSLIKFKCVCKDWRRVITNSQFAYNQYATNRSFASSIHYIADSLVKTLSACGEVNLLALPFRHEFQLPNQIFLRHSCNGLDLFSDKNIKLFVCNLTTQQYVLLPHNPHNENWYVSQVCLAFDPTISPHYKVVQMKIGQVGPIDMYSSKNNSWKRIHVTGARVGYRFVFLDGAIHWINESNYVRFLVDEERLITTQMPPKPKILKNYNIRYFGECGGQLVLIQCRRRSRRFKVFEMKKGTCCWDVKYQVDLNIVTHLKGNDDYYLLGIVKESHKSDHKLLLVASPGQFISYNLNQRTVDVLGEISWEEFSLGGLVWFPKSPFIESLFPVSFYTGS